MEQQTAREDFRRVERREWWLWAAAFIITFLLTAALASFFLPIGGGHQDIDRTLSLRDAPAPAIRGLVALVFLFDLYTIYQHLLIYRIRKELLDREELFHLINENAADMIAVVDRQGKRVFNSLSYSKVLGYSREELESSLSFEQVHPNDRELVKCAAEEAFRSGVGKTLVYRFRHKNGIWLLLESTSSVIRNVAGEPEKLLIVNRDITERHKAEENMRRSEAHFRSLVEHAPYGIYRSNAAGNFLQVNAALQKILLYEDGQELLAQNLPTDIFDKEEEYHRLTELLIRNEGMKGIEVQWKRNDGTLITVHCSGQIIKGEETDESYLQVFVEDITEKRLLERQLRMAQKMEAIGRLSGGIAHDFNNLLGVIIGYSGVLRKALRTDSTLCDHALEIEKAGQRAASLTKQLLAFSRQQVLTPAVLNLNSIVLDLEKMLRRVLGEDIELSLSLEPNLDRVKADQSQIEQVIMNLVVNARDAMPRGGRLTIQTANIILDEDYTRSHTGSQVGEYTSIIVTDTGTGMDAGTLAHVFEPFFTTKEPGKGTGLGLATVYGIVKQSIGYIWVDSAPGNGSSFQIYLPRYRGQSSEQRRANIVHNLRGTERVLLVEDAEPLRRLAQAFLEKNGFHVSAARNGEDALDLGINLKGNIDLLLTDVVMPGMNGRVLAERLLARYPEVKVLYMSGYTDSCIAEHGVLEAGTHLLHKPFTEEGLIRKVREVLDARTEAQPLSC